MFHRALLIICLMASPALAQSRDERFDPARLDQLSFMEGTFEISELVSDREGGWVPRNTFTVNMERDLYGAIIVENRHLESMDAGISTLTIFSYDPFRETYRVIVSGSYIGLTDIFEGQMVDGRLVVDNVGPGTSYEAPDGTVYNYQLWFEDTEGPGYARGINISWDDGATFYPWIRSTATPVAD